MNVVVLGTGYVGLPTGVGLAELGHRVICLDRDTGKIEALRQGRLTLFEAGLEELFHKNCQAGRLSFTADKRILSQAELIIIAVGTPPHPVTLEADLKYIHAAAVEIAGELSGYTTVVIKSTVPVGTAEDVEYLIRKSRADADFDLVSMPEFLREGFAVHDFFHPDRIVVGTESPRAIENIKRLYGPMSPQPPILFVKRRSAELIKYASNAFLALKIHYINEMADLCVKAGAEVEEVSLGMGLDSRIGAKFLKPGPGYGGSCFPKDTLALAFMARQREVNLSLVEAVIKGNAERKSRIAAQVMERVSGISKPQIGVLGLAFKNGTDDCRESPAMEIIEPLLKHKFSLKVYDPLAMEKAKPILGDRVTYAEDMYQAAQGADLLLILTECDEFANFDLDEAGPLMRRRFIMDCRNILCPRKTAEADFELQRIGRDI